MVNEHQHHFGFYSVSVLQCHRDARRVRAELLCALLLLLPVVLLTALLLPLNKLRLFRDGVGILFRFGVVLFRGKGRISCESVMKTFSLCSAFSVTIYIFYYRIEALFCIFLSKLWTFLLHPVCICHQFLPV